MARVIYKYSIPLIDESELELPTEHWPLSVGLDPNGNMCLWAEVEVGQSDTAIVTRKIRVVGTGQPRVPSEDEFEFIGSVLMVPWVWHIYLEKLE